MYAIVDIGGLQYKVSKSVVIRVPKLKTEPGKSIELKNVLLLVDKDKVQVGKPTIANASVSAKVISHGKDKKVMVFKKKRRKNYRVLRGHRQEYTEIQIDQISTGKAGTAKPVKTAAAPKAAAKTPAKPASKAKPAAKPASDKSKAAKKTAPGKKKEKFDENDSCRIRQGPGCPAQRCQRRCHISRGKGSSNQDR